MQDILGAVDVISPSLIRDLKAQRVILFVGSGVSRGLGVPSWEEVIDEIARRLHFDPAVFKQYGGFLELAEYYEIRARSLRKLRQWMNRTWHKRKTAVDSSLTHQAIVDLGFKIIYTTNYDRWIEIAFERRGKRILKIANVGDFAQIDTKVTQLVKLHGDVESDQGLVLSEGSYFDRFEFESPLDIKLRSDSIGNSILFIGYSLTDVNVRFLLYKLHKLWAASEFARDRPRSYMFVPHPNPVQEAVLFKRGIQPIVSTHDDPQLGLERFMKSLVKRTKTAKR